MKKIILLLILYFISINLLFGKGYEKVVTIDPGHGTKYSREGAYGEAELAMRLSIYIKEYLEKSGIKVILTHKKYDRTEILGENYEEDNIARAEISNEADSDLYFRIHFDSPEGKAAVYYPKEHKDEYVKRESLKAANLVFEALKVITEKNRAKISNKVLTDNDTYVGNQLGGLLAGSKASKEPTILIESAGLNEEMLKWFNNEDNLHYFALKISEAIKKYLGKID